MGPTAVGCQLAPEAKLLVDALSKLMIHRLPEFDGRGLANVAWSFGKLKYVPTQVSRACWVLWTNLSDCKPLLAPEVYTQHHADPASPPCEPVAVTCPHSIRHVPAVKTPVCPPAGHPQPAGTRGPQQDRQPEPAEHLQHAVVLCVHAPLQ